MDGDAGIEPVQRQALIRVGVGEADVHLVHQGRGTQRVVGGLTAEAAARELSQLVSTSRGVGAPNRRLRFVLPCLSSSAAQLWSERWQRLSRVRGVKWPQLRGNRVGC